jgi:Ion transport protein
MESAHHNNELVKNSKRKVRVASFLDETTCVDIVNEGVVLEENPALNFNGDLNENVSEIITRRIKQWSRLCGEIVNREKFQLFIVFLIAVNAVMMGVATFDFVQLDPPVYSAFEITDTVFLIIFTVELAMQLIYHGPRLFLDGWLVFDFVIIILSWALSSLQIIRAFRIFRALRLVNRIKVMRNLVLALGNVMPRMAAISVLLLLIFYIYAVCFTQLFGDLYANGALDANYFGRMDNTFFTLFQIMTLDSWNPISQQLMAEISWAWLPMLSFVIISAFIVVNLVIAVICGAVAALEAREKAMIMGDSLLEHVGENYTEHLIQQHVREELAILEDTVQKLTLLQARTLQALEVMTNHMKSTPQM